MNELSNNEIRAKIAKLRGANWWEIDGKAYLCGMSHAAMLPKGVKMVDEPPAGSAVYYRVDNWPCDMREAWKLVDDIKPENVGIEISSIQYDKTGLWTYEVTLYDPIGGHKCKKYIAEDEKASRAICLAWLAWKAAQ